MDQDEREKHKAGKPKPIPIRESVGQSGPRTAPKSQAASSVPSSQAPGLRGQRERPKGPRAKGASHRKDGGRRRRPDRKGAGPDGERPPRPPLEPTPLEDLPFRNFGHDGCEWIVRLCGQTSTGSDTDPGALLMHLVFYTAADPLVACGDVLVPGSSLQRLPELRLRELLSDLESARRLTNRADKASQG